MTLLQHGVDRAVIVLWLGHESVETTKMYLHADMRMKERVLAKVASNDQGVADNPGDWLPWSYRETLARKASIA